MGVFDFMKRGAKNVFRGAKRAGKNLLRGASRAARGAARKVSSVLSPINEAAKKIADKLNVDIPLVGNPIERLKNVPKLGTAIRALSSVSSGVDALEAFGKGDDSQALQQMKDVAKNLAPKKARRVLGLVDRLSKLSGGGGGSGGGGSGAGRLPVFDAGRISRLVDRLTTG